MYIFCFTTTVFILQCARIPNRQLVSTWSENGKVYIWDISRQFLQVENENSTTKASSEHKALYTFSGHQVSRTGNMLHGLQTRAHITNHEIGLQGKFQVLYDRKKTQ